MAASTEERSGLSYGWSLGENNWNTLMDSNLLQIGRLALGGGIIDRGLTAPPGSPSAGDAYIVAATATGDWASQEDDIAVYDGTDWVFYTAPDGFGVFILDEEVWSVFVATSGWSDGVSHTWT